MAFYPLVPREGGNNSSLNITVPTVVKASPGTVYAVSVITAPSAAGGIYDAATTGGAVAANKVAAIPTTTAPTYPLVTTWPCKTGIVIDPGTAGVVSVSFS